MLCLIDKLMLCLVDKLHLSFKILALTKYGEKQVKNILV